MILKLHFPPTPGNAPRFAAHCVEGVKSISHIDLDYSPSSLYHLDGIVGDMRNDGVTSEKFAETLFTFGCYVGEVFVRNAAGQWRDTEETVMRGLAQFPIVVELGNGKLCNPIGKVFKRMDNGIEDHLPYFYRVFAEQEVSEPEPVSPRKDDAEPKKPQRRKRFFGLFG